MSIGSQTYALLDQMKEYPYDGFFNLTAAQLLQAGIQGDFGLMLCCTGTLFPVGDFTPVLPLLLGRMLCGGLWAEAGCLFSLLTETASAAYLAPLCLCYAMVMLGTRFFPQAAFLNPTNWLAAPVWALVLGMAALSLWLVWVLERKVNRYV